MEPPKGSSIYTRICAYQGVRNVNLSEHFAYVLNGWTLRVWNLRPLLKIHPQETADLDTFTEESFNEKLQFLCSVTLVYSHFRITWFYISQLFFSRRVNKYLEKISWLISISIILTSINPFKFQFSFISMLFSTVQHLLQHTGSKDTLSEKLSQVQKFAKFWSFTWINFRQCWSIKISRNTNKKEF